VRLVTHPACATLDAETLQAHFRSSWSATGSQYYVGLAFLGVSVTICAWLLLIGLRES
jgi:hypothetical protein